MPLGVDLEIDHEPGHSSIWADGLSRDFENVLAQFSPTNRVHIDIDTLLHRHTAWTLIPDEAHWPDHLRTGFTNSQKTQGASKGAWLSAAW